MFLVLIFTRGWVDPRAMVRSEGNMSLKNPVTPPGIDPGTVRLVAQRLNHYATPGAGTPYRSHRIKTSSVCCSARECVDQTNNSTKTQDFYRQYEGRFTDEPKPVFWGEHKRSITTNFLFIYEILVCSATCFCQLGHLQVTQARTEYVGRN